MAWDQLKISTLFHFSIYAKCIFEGCSLSFHLTLRSVLSAFCNVAPLFSHSLKDKCHTCPTSYFFLNICFYFSINLAGHFYCFKKNIKHFVTKSPILLSPAKGRRIKNQSTQRKKSRLYNITRPTSRLYP